MISAVKSIDDFLYLMHNHSAVDGPSQVNEPECCLLPSDDFEQSMFTPNNQATVSYFPNFSTENKDKGQRTLSLHKTTESKFETSDFESSDAGSCISTENRRKRQCSIASLGNTAKSKERYEVLNSYKTNFFNSADTRNCVARKSKRAYWDENSQKENDNQEFYRYEKCFLSLTPQKMFVCDICNEEFLKEDDLNAHYHLHVIKNLHKGEDCEKCNEEEKNFLLQCLESAERKKVCLLKKEKKLQLALRYATERVSIENKRKRFSFKSRKVSNKFLAEIDRWYNSTADSWLNGITEHDDYLGDNFTRWDSAVNKERIRFDVSSLNKGKPITDEDDEVTDSADEGDQMPDSVDEDDEMTDSADEGDQMTDSAVNKEERIRFDVCSLNMDKPITDEDDEMTDSADEGDQMPDSADEDDQMTDGDQVTDSADTGDQVMDSADGDRETDSTGEDERTDSEDEGDQQIDSEDEGDQQTDSEDEEDQVTDSADEGEQTMDSSDNGGQGTDNTNEGNQIMDSIVNDGQGPSCTDEGDQMKDIIDKTEEMPTVIYFCEKCNLEFKSESDVAIHNRQHFKFQCSMCSSAFEYTKHLYKRLPAFLSLSPFLCNVEPKWKRRDSNPKTDFVLTTGHSSEKGLETEQGKVDELIPFKIRPNPRLDELISAVKAAVKAQKVASRPKATAPKLRHLKTKFKPKSPRIKKSIQGLKNINQPKRSVTRQAKQSQQNKSSGTYDPMKLPVQKHCTNLPLTKPDIFNSVESFLVSHTENGSQNKKVSGFRHSLRQRKLSMYYDERLYVKAAR